MAGMFIRGTIVFLCIAILAGCSQVTGDFPLLATADLFNPDGVADIFQVSAFEPSGNGNSLPVSKPDDPYATISQMLTAGYQFVLLNKTMEERPEYTAYVYLVDLSKTSGSSSEEQYLAIALASGVGEATYYFLSRVTGGWVVSGLSLGDQKYFVAMSGAAEHRGVALGYNSSTSLELKGSVDATAMRALFTDPVFLQGLLVSPELLLTRVSGSNLRQRIASLDYRVPFPPPVVTENSSPNARAPVKQSFPTDLVGTWQSDGSSCAYTDPNLGPGSTLLINTTDQSTFLAFSPHEGEGSSCSVTSVSGTATDLRVAGQCRVEESPPEEEEIFLSTAADDASISVRFGASAAAETYVRCGRSSVDPWSMYVTDHQVISRVQNKLFQLNYDVGPDDGVIGERTLGALHTFQGNMGVTPGPLTVGTVNILDGTKAPTLWAAVAFTAGGTWGSATQFPTRAAAEDQAARGLNTKATAGKVMAVFGPACLAIAHWRDRSEEGVVGLAGPTPEDAGNAALRSCPAGASSCKLLTSVCADNRNGTGSTPSSGLRPGASSASSAASEAQRARNALTLFNKVFPDPDVTP